MLSNSSQGLGEIVQRKKAAYQDNPQGLQQRYQQSQQLTDLLALQQLKSEKEAAARNMQMAMQQNPATIAQQREQEVLGLIKQEQGRNLGKVSQQVGGILGQRQQEATKRRQQMGMAQGGIVGFDGGGSVTSEDIEDFRRSNPKSRRFSDEQIKQTILKQREAQKTMEAVGTFGLDLAKAAAGQPTSEIEAQMAAKTGKAAPTTLQAAPKADGKNPGAAVEDRLESYQGKRPSGVLPKPTPDPNALTKQGVGVKQNIQDFEAQKNPPAATQGIARLEVAKPDFAGTTAQRDAAKGILTDVGIDPEKDPDVERKKRIQDTKKEMGLEGLLKRKDDQLTRLKTQQEELSRGSGLDRFIAGASASARRGGPGGYGAGSLAERKAQKAQQRLDLAAQFGIEDAKIKLEFDVTAKGIESGDKLANIISQEKQHYAEVMQKATEADYEQASATADRIMQSDQQNIQTDLAVLADTTERAIAAAEGRRDEADQLYGALQNNMEKRLEILGPVYELMGIDRASGDFSSEEMAEKLRQAQITQAELSEASNLFALEESMIARLEALGRPVESMRTDLNRSRAVLEGLRATDAKLKGQK